MTIVWVRDENKGLSPLYKPGGRLFECCAAGNLLMLAPAALPYLPGEKKITRVEALTLNRIAQLICVWGVTDAGYCALDGSFSVTLDWSANVERFSNALSWLNFGFLGLLASAACFVMWNYACREIGVVHTTIGLYLTPIVGVIFAAVFLGERLTPMSTLGGFCIIVGVAVANWRKK